MLQTKIFRNLIVSCSKASRYHPLFLRLNFPSWFILSLLFLCAEKRHILNSSLLSQRGKKASYLKFRRMNVVLLMGLKIHELKSLTLSSSIIWLDVVWISFYCLCEASQEFICAEGSSFLEELIVSWAVGWSGQHRSVTWCFWSTCFRNTMWLNAGWLLWKNYPATFNHDKQTQEGVRAGAISSVFKELCK